MLQPVTAVLAEVCTEAASAMVKFGPQTGLPDGTGSEAQALLAEAAKAHTDRAAEAGEVTWRDVLNEEVLEAFGESDPARLRQELVQVMAVCLRWIDAIDERSG